MKNLLIFSKSTKEDCNDESRQESGVEEAASESESESSQRSSTGRDFEMVDRDDIET